MTCNGREVFSNVSAITVNNPVISAAPTPLSTCAGGTATLTATVPTGVGVRFYSAATGGTLVGTGSPFVTPAITANTTYYAEAFTGGQENVGKPSTNGADGTNTGGGLYFTTTARRTITNVTVYRSRQCRCRHRHRSIADRQQLTGTTITPITVPVPANTTGAISPPTYCTLNLPVPAAGN